MARHRLGKWQVLAAAVAIWPALASGLEKVKRDNVRGTIFREDPEKVWTLTFWYNRPRMIRVKEPGKSTKLYWYVTYVVMNDTAIGKARKKGKEREILFVPEFTLVTDTDKVYRDVVVPAAERLAKIRSDATIKYYNSVTIAGAIPASKPDGKDYAKRGIVMFDSVDLSTDFFSIYVTGLSNGYREVTNPKTRKKVIRRKTLRLKFAMPGDNMYPNEDEIFSQGWEWVYR